MLVDTYQREVNNLDKEIADLTRKKSECDKKCAELQSKIISTQKSINQNTPQGIKANKERQISSFQNDLTRKTTESAGFSHKIADKQKKRNNAYLKLQKAQYDETQKQQQEQKKIQQTYERRIRELQSQSVPVVPIAIRRAELTTSTAVAEEYDVFISHAFEDKEEFVDELVSEMRKLDLKVWYDTDRVAWGDSLREKIEIGLKKSRYGIVVLSPNYIAENKYWTKAELNGLFQKETYNGKVILPIWHNLTKKQVTEYSLIIADRKAMTTADFTAEEMAAELKNLLEVSKE